METFSYNGAKKLKTPNMDAMAMAGMRFNNGYATSATCTPSRYALLTGVYPWREKRARILGRYCTLDHWN
jgi:arylsulfatase A-like enzyme